MIGNVWYYTTIERNPRFVMPNMQTQYEHIAKRYAENLAQGDYRGEKVAVYMCPSRDGLPSDLEGCRCVYAIEIPKTKKEFL